MKILVTAFEPFLGETENPTMRIISALEDVATLVLPVSFADAPETAFSHIRDSSPDAVILLGQAGGRAAISLERVAINLADASIPDNNGYHPIGSTIFENAPTAYLSNLPLMEICDDIRDAGVTCHISNSAGTYVCNTLYYSVRHTFPELPALFIHVPYTPHQAVGKKSTTPSMNVADMITAVRTTIFFIRKHCNHSLSESMNARRDRY